MIVQIYMKGDKLEKCDHLIIKDDTEISVSAKTLSDLAEINVITIKENESMLVKSAIILNDIISKSDCNTVTLICADTKTTMLSELMSVEYKNKDGNSVKITNQKQQDSVKKKRRTPKREDTNTKPNNIPDTKEEPADTSKKPPKTSGKTTNNAKDVLKSKGIPPEIIDICIDAIEDSSDKTIGLPFQLKLKMSAAGLTGDYDLDDITRKCTEVFDSVKK